MLDHFYRTTLTPEIIPEIGVTGDIPSVIFTYPALYEQLHLIPSTSSHQLRAPPAAA